MTLAKRTGVQAATVVCFVAGLMLFLNGTRSRGEALETFKLMVSFTDATMVGIALMGFAAITGVVLFILGKKRKPE